MMILPDGMIVTRASVQEVFTCRADDDEDEERKRMLRSETREVVAPELFRSREQSPTINEAHAGSAG